jgi:natural product precursor
MKKTQRTKLNLNRETVRALTKEDLTLVVGGACKHGTTNSAVPPPSEDTVAGLDRGHPTC